MLCQPDVVEHVNCCSSTCKLL